MIPWTVRLPFKLQPPGTSALWIGEARLTRHLAIRSGRVRAPVVDPPVLFALVLVSDLSSPCFDQDTSLNRDFDVSLLRSSRGRPENVSKDSGREFTRQPQSPRPPQVIQMVHSDRVLRCPHWCLRHVVHCRRYAQRIGFYPAGPVENRPAPTGTGPPDKTG